MDLTPGCAYLPRLFILQVVPLTELLTWGRSRLFSNRALMIMNNLFAVCSLESFSATVGGSNNCHGGRKLIGVFRP